MSLSRRKSRPAPELKIHEGDFVIHRVGNRLTGLVIEVHPWQMNVNVLWFDETGLTHMTSAYNLRVIRYEDLTDREVACLAAYRMLTRG